MKINAADIIGPLSDSLKDAVKEILADVTDPELTKLTLDVAATAAEVAVMPASPEKDALLNEIMGSLRIIAEKHRVDLTEVAHGQIQAGIKVGVGLIGRLIMQAI